MDKARKKRWIERGKTLLILLLTVSAVFLAIETGLFRGVSTMVGTQEGQTQVSSTEASAWPAAIAVVGAGGIYAQEYSAQLDQLYEDTGRLLGEALGSSQAPERIAESQWRQYLEGGAIYFVYRTQVPMAILAGWLGTNVTHAGAEHLVRCLLLTPSGDGNAALLCYREEGSGTFYQMATAASSSELSGQLSAYEANNYGFAYDAGAVYGHLDPYTLLPASGPEAVNLVSVSPLTEDWIEEILTSLGVSAYTASTYVEADGTRVYVESDGSLRISPTGELSFHRTGDSDRLQLGADATAGEVVELARSLAMDTIGRFFSAATVELADYSYNQMTGAYTVSFGYFINGAEVCFGDGGHGATIVIQDGAVQDLKLVFRVYTVTEAATGLLPKRQAAAIAQGDRLRLVYQDRLNEVLQPFWTS